MFIDKILLKNYRNIKETMLDLSPNLNIILGYNGQGKTNLLESIYLLGTGSSHRSNVDSDLINWHREKALVQVLLKKKDQDLRLSLIFTASQKRIEINNTPYKKISDLIGNLNIVLFSPEDLNLIKGGPSYRRKFLDIEVSQVSPYYYHLLNEYKHILKQRNNLLKNIRDKKDNKELLEVWDEKLVETGSKVINKRIDVVEKLKLLARLGQRKITNGSENLKIDYDCSLSNTGKKEETDIIFKQDLVNNRKEEIYKGYTIFGPHRDDLILKVNDIDIRKFGSQGQQRTTALALKLAELEFMKSETGEYPVLLLDDVFSELDELRRNTLLSVVTDRIQTIITATDLSIPSVLKRDHYKVFNVREGNIKEE
ncbi:DNA replication/repair protein RecF [Halocella sp. SP3-1]|nr:DNA replication/repair protein RecF [Halocella sp. SP3-1]